MTDIDNNKLMGLLVIAGGGLLLIQEHINERRKWRQWVHPWTRERDSKEAYYPIIMISGWRIKNKLKLCVSTFYILYKWTLLIKKFFTTHACLCFYVMEFKNQKNILCTSEALLCFTQKNNFCIMNKIKLVWFFDLFIYFKNNFYHVTLVTLFIEYWIILYIFRISLCVTST